MTTQRAKKKFLVADDFFLFLFQAKKPSLPLSRLRCLWVSSLLSSLVSHLSFSQFLRVSHVRAALRAKRVWNSFVWHALTSTATPPQHRLKCQFPLFLFFLSFLLILSLSLVGLFLAPSPDLPSTFGHWILWVNPSSFFLLFFLPVLSSGTPLVPGTGPSPQLLAGWADYGSSAPAPLASSSSFAPSVSSASLSAPSSSAPAPSSLFSGPGGPRSLAPPPSLGARHHYSPPLSLLFSPLLFSSGFSGPPPPSFGAPPPPPPSFGGPSPPGSMPPPPPPPPADDWDLPPPPPPPVFASPSHASFLPPPPPPPPPI